MRVQDDFEPHLGRMRARSRGKVRTYLGRVLAAANLARGAGISRSSPRGGPGRSAKASGFGRALRGFKAHRRVMIKARIVRLGGKGAAGASAHLKYLQRDGTTRTGDHGDLYGRDCDAVIGKTLIERSAGDRHQFRFIVSAEDGADYEDLKPFTRRLMAQAEQDLGTRLDWVAVDHFNTGHPHTHIMLRGVDERGADLVIARDYLSHGLRARASELVELDLGPMLPHEERARQLRDVEAERLTRLDQDLIADAAADGMVSAAGSTGFTQSLRAGRLAKLGQLGLATPVGAGRWTLRSDAKDVLHALSERGDIIRTMQREFSRRGLRPAVADQVIYDPASPNAQLLVGRLVSRGLADEARDRHYVLIDATDGRLHYVAIGAADALPPCFENAIVRIAPKRLEPRPADHVITQIAAANGGTYSAELHRLHDPEASDAFIEAHTRRLEAMRKLAGSVGREKDGRWTVGHDHLARAEAFEAKRARDRPVVAEILSERPLGELIHADGATWLDRRLAAAGSAPARDAGFGKEIAEASAARIAWLGERGLLDADGRVTQAVVATLAQRELMAACAQQARLLGAPCQVAIDGDRVTGMLREKLSLVSGDFAMVERVHDFVLVPWRDVLGARLNKQVSGVLQRGEVNWSFGRTRSGPSR